MLQMTCSLFLTSARSKLHCCHVEMAQSDQASMFISLHFTRVSRQSSQTAGSREENSDAVVPVTACVRGAGDILKSTNSAF